MRRFTVGWTHPLPDGTTRALHVPVSADDGAFALEGAPRGPVTLFCKRDGDPRFALREVRAGEDGPFVLDLSEGLVITGRIRPVDDTSLQIPPHHHAGAAARYVDLGLFWRVQVAADGAFQFRGLPPGLYDLSGYCEGYRIERVLDVRAPASNVVLRASR